MLNNARWASLLLGCLSSLSIADIGSTSSFSCLVSSPSLVPVPVHINELNSDNGGASFDFIELKVLENGVSVDGWRLCFSRSPKQGCWSMSDGDWYQGGVSGSIPSSGAVYNKDTWLVFRVDDLPKTSGGLSQLSQTSGEVLLLNGSEGSSTSKVVDYLAYSDKANCSDVKNWTVNSDCGVCFDGKKANEKNLARQPDGSGVWGNNGNTSTVGTDNSGDPVVVAVDHYQLSYDSSPGITCQATTVTATAHDGKVPDAELIPANDLELTFSSAAGCHFTSPKVKFNGSSSVSSQMTCSSTGPAEVSVVDTNGAQDAAVEDPGINFVKAKFEFYNQSASSNLLPTQTSGKRSDQSPGDASLQLRAIVTDPNTGACVARIQSAPVDVQMDFQCIDPGSCIAGQALRVENRLGVEQSLPGTVSLDFDADGRADIPFVYTDAGRILMQASAILPEASPFLENNLVGASNDFVVKPAGLCVDVAETSAECAALDGSCGVFRQAGALFTLSVRGVGWESSGEANIDFCTGNSTTPNYRDAAIGLTSDWAATESGVAGVLAIGSAAIVADGAVSIGNQSVSEVGVFEFTATPSSYMGEVVAASTSAAVGRFTPAYFTLSTGLLDNRSELVCSDSFNYLGEVFQASFTLNAWNLDGLPVVNYGGTFAKFTSYSQLGVGAVDLAGGGLDLSSRLISQPGFAFSLSSGDVSVVAPLLVERAASVDGPFESVAIGTAAVDSDGIGLRVSDYDLDTDLDLSNERIQIGLPTAFYFGRLRVENAFGPETEALPVLAQLEYFNGAGFVRNLLDSCSPLALDIIAPALGRVVSGAAISVGAGTSALQLSTPADLGDLALVFGAPGLGSSGEIEFQFSDSASPVGSGIGSLPWLLFDWDGDGAFADDPGARKANFGRYRGHDRVIYWQENFSR